MADEITRPELDAKLETVEARAEKRFTELSSKLDILSLSIQNSVGAINAAVENGIKASEKDSLDRKQELSGLKKEIGEVRGDNKYTRTTIIVTIIASILAGLAALWVTQANLLSAFQTGLTIHSDPTAAPSTKPPANGKTSNPG